MCMNQFIRNLVVSLMVFMLCVVLIIARSIHLFIEVLETTIDIKVERWVEERQAQDDV